MKITLVGAGAVGSTTGLRLLEAPLSEMVFVDLNAGLARAVALDLAQTAPRLGFTTRLYGGSDYAESTGSDVVIVMAGLARRPGMTRRDLTDANARIVEAVVGEVSATSPDAALLIVTNPLDEMTTLACSVSGFAKEKVVGMAGYLDTLRFCHFIAGKLAVPPCEVEALTLGSHGEEMVPVTSAVKVQGKPLEELLSEAEIGEIVHKTQNGGAEIVELLGKGSAYYAPSLAVATMAKALLGLGDEMLSACAYTNGPYGITDTFIGVPVTLSKGGVKEVHTLPLRPDELRSLRHAALVVRERCNNVLTGISS